MMMPKKKAPPWFALIMAGGKGRRFWPRSRVLLPKQLLPIGTPQPLLRATIDRLRPLLPPEHIFIAASHDLGPAVARLTPEIPRRNFILEPEPRDTTAAVGFALEHIRSFSPAVSAEAVVAMLPADHLIGRPGRFRQTLLRAVKYAFQRKCIMTIGIVPDRPSSAYGYIQPGKPLPAEKNIFYVRRFIEKPDLSRARRYLRQGFLWNAGMFIFRLDVMAEAYQKHVPDMAHELFRLGKNLSRPDGENAVRRIFRRLRKISLDYAIMEKTENAAVIPGDFDWADVGGWDALYCRLACGHEGENVCCGPVKMVDSVGCYVEGEKLIALVGVKNLVVIETPDAILVMDRAHEAKLKRLIEEMEAEGRSEL